MFCTNCGSQFEDGNAFCPNCGSKVESVAQPVAEPAPVATPVEAAPVAAAPVEAAPVAATPVEAAPVEAVPVAAAVPIATPYEPAPAPAPAPAPVAPVPPMAAPVQPVYAQAPMGVTPVMPANPGDSSLATNILVMGIVAVATACTVWFGFLGIIFGAIGLTKAKKFTEDCGQLQGKAKVGKDLSLGGLIAGCVVTAYIAIYILAAVLGVIAELN